MTEKARSEVRTSESESAKPEWVDIGRRLVRIRSGLSQAKRAENLGVHPNTYARWERGEREIGADALRELIRRGFNANWVLTGEGPMRFDQIAQTGEPAESQPLSDANLTIALEFADRCVGDGWLPKPLYAKLVRLLYEGVTQGLPVAEVLQLGKRVSKALAQGESIDDGGKDVGPAGRAGAG